MGVLTPGHARHLGKRDAGLRRNREKGDGSPSLSPKASTIPYDDDHLLFVDIASPQTIANLRNDPRIEINSVDFIRRRGSSARSCAATGSEALPPIRQQVFWETRSLRIDLHVVPGERKTKSSIRSKSSWSSCNRAILALGGLVVV